MKHSYSLNFYFLLLFACLFSCKKESPESELAAPVIEQPPVQAPAENKNVLMVVTSNAKLKDGSGAGYFLPEAVDFYRELAAAGYQVTIASPAGGKAPMYERANYVVQYRSYLDSTGLLYKLDSSITLASVKSSDYKAVFYVGGFACLFDFPSNPDIKRITADIYQAGGVVAAVCHAPAALLNVTLPGGELLIKGKKLTGRTMAEETNNGQLTRDDVLYYFPFVLEEELKGKGAIYSHAPIGRPYSVTDGKLVTGQNPESGRLVAQAAIALMKK